MHDIAQTQPNTTDAQTMKQLGIVIFGLVGVTLGLLLAVSIIT